MTEKHVVEWQPMETCPRDEDRYYVLKDELGFPHLCQWSSNYWIEQLHFEAYPLDDKPVGWIEVPL